MWLHFPSSWTKASCFALRPDFSCGSTTHGIIKARFIRRVQHLGYNAQYRVFGDLDLNQRMLKNDKNVRLFDQVVCHHLNNGISMSRADFHEVYRSIRDNFGTPYVAIAFLWFKYKGMRHRGKRLANYLSSSVAKS